MIDNVTIIFSSLDEQKDIIKKLTKLGLEYIKESDYIFNGSFININKNQFYVSAYCNSTIYESLNDFNNHNKNL